MKGVKGSKATLCEVMGHDWQPTTSDKVMVCGRGSCKLVKQLVKGHWKHLTKVVVKGGAERIANEAVELASLWGE